MHSNQLYPTAFESQQRCSPAVQVCSAVSFFLLLVPESLSPKPTSLDLEMQQFNCIAFLLQSVWRLGLKSSFFSLVAFRNIWLRHYSCSMGLDGLQGIYWYDFCTHNALRKNLFGAQQTRAWRHFQIVPVPLKINSFAK